jgi:hypothetical protein
MDFDTVMRLLNGGGVLAILVLIVVSGQMGLWVWKRELDGVLHQLKEAQDDAEEWKLMALRGTNTAERITATTQELVTALRAAAEKS